MYKKHLRHNGRRFTITSTVDFADVIEVKHALTLEPMNDALHDALRSVTAACACSYVCG